MPSPGAPSATQLHVLRKEKEWWDERLYNDVPYSCPPLRPKKERWQQGTNKLVWHISMNQDNRRVSSCTLTRQPKVLLKQKVICSFTYMFQHPNSRKFDVCTKGSLYHLVIHSVLIKSQWRKINPSPCLLFVKGRSYSSPEAHSFFQCILQSSEEESS